jgi:transcription antitermination factor NusG
VENSLCGGKGEALSEVANCVAAELASVCQEDVVQDWLAVYTAPCHEKHVAEHLAIREIEHFLPLYRLSRHWKDGRRVTLDSPLFPSYVFVHGSRANRASILGTPGVLYIVGTKRGAVALPTAEIESLRKGLHLHNAEPHPFLNVGERATVRSGALAGLQGIVLRHKNSTRIVISLELIMKSVAVEIDAADLEPLRPSLYPYRLNSSP